MLMASIPRFEKEEEKEEDKLPNEVENLNEIMGL